MIRLMGYPPMNDGWGDPHADPAEAWDRALPNEKQLADAVNSPPHYTGFSNNAEVIDITENLNFNRGSACKYLARAGRKDPAKEIEDLEKAAWYVHREIARVRSRGV
jgi:hypothetical protein